MRRSLAVAVAMLLLSTELQAGIIRCRASTFFRNTLNDEKRVCRQADAGSAHVAVLSVAPWEEYVNSLQPIFSLTIDDAMKEVLPATSTMEETVLRALIAKIEAAGPKITNKQTESEKVKADGTKEKTSEQTNVEETGDASTAKPPAGVTGSNPLDFSKDTAKIAGELPVDPMMRRLAALALYQEAQILSRHIADASVPKHYRPYVVRFQVTLMPNARREPYDAYTTVTFLAGQEQEYRRTPEAFEKETLYRTMAAKPRGLVRVVPLLVTDNIESTRRADVAQQIRDLSAAVVAMSGNVNVSAGVRSQLNRLTKSQSNDFNSLLTVARLSENSIRVRLGALQGNNQYTMIPRTHNITILAMVPDGNDEIRYISKSMMHDAIHGTALSVARSGVFGSRYKDVIDGWRKAYGLPKGQHHYTSLIPHAQSANFDEFRRHILVSILPSCEACPSNPTEAFIENLIQRMWADVSSYNGMDQFGEGRFALPPARYQSRRFFAEKIQVSPLDNGRFVTVRMRGSRYVDPARLRARLRVDLDGRLYFLDATRITKTAADEFELRFPSARRTISLGTKTPGQKSALLLSYAPSQFIWDDGPAFASHASYSAAFREKLNGGEEVSYPIETFIFDGPPDPGFSIAVATNVIDATKTPPRLKFTITRSSDKVDKVFFAIRGADIEGIEPTPKGDNKEMFAIADETYEVKLANVTPFSDVVITAFSLNGEDRLPAEDLRIRVVK